MPAWRRRSRRRRNCSRSSKRRCGLLACATRSIWATCVVPQRVRQQHRQWPRRGGRRRRRQPLARSGAGAASRATRWSGRRQVGRTQCKRQQSPLSSMGSSNTSPSVTVASTQETSSVRGSRGGPRGGPARWRAARLRSSPRVSAHVTLMVVLVSARWRAARLSASPGVSAPITLMVVLVYARWRAACRAQARSKRLLTRDLEYI